jgi:hypothetical protein
MVIIAARPAAPHHPFTDLVMAKSPNRISFASAPAPNIPKQLTVSNQTMT